MFNWWSDDESCRRRDGCSMFSPPLVKKIWLLKQTEILPLCSLTFFLCYCIRFILFFIFYIFLSILFILNSSFWRTVQITDSQHEQRWSPPRLEAAVTPRLIDRFLNTRMNSKTGSCPPPPPPSGRQINLKAEMIDRIGKQKNWILQHKVMISHFFSIFCFFLVNKWKKVDIVVQ